MRSRKLHLLLLGQRRLLQPLRRQRVIRYPWVHISGGGFILGTLPRSVVVRQADVGELERSGLGSQFDLGRRLHLQWQHALADRRQGGNGIFLRR
jgi:hypothetical protein